MQKQFELSQSTLAMCLIGILCILLVVWALERAALARGRLQRMAERCRLERAEEIRLAAAQSEKEKYWQNRQAHLRLEMQSAAKHAGYWPDQRPVKTERASINTMTNEVSVSAPFEIQDSEFQSFRPVFADCHDSTSASTRADQSSASCSGAE